MSPSNSPCAACKIQRRKCTQDCVFAPYFPPDNPQRFSYVHQVFGASNVAKILGDINPAQREDAVKSLAYEAEARLRDPVYGCVGVISVLQHTLKLLQAQLLTAKKELASYVGVGVGPPPMHGIPPNAPQLIMPDQLFQAQSQAQAQAQQFAMAATRDQDDMMHQDILRLNHGSPSGMPFNDIPSSAPMSPSMPLMGMGPHFSNHFPIDQSHNHPHHHP